MKVALVNGTFGGISGSGRHVFNLHNYLKEKCEFTVYDLKTVGFINFPKLKSISFYNKLKKIKIDADIIHIHNPKFGGIIKNPSSSILTIHGDFVTEFEKKYGLLGKKMSNQIKKIIKNFEIITTVNPYWAKENDWLYIPNGISLKEIEPIKPSQKKYVLFVGRKDKIKGYDIFKKISNELPFPSKMLFNYPWKEVISHMKSAYCLVMPSKSEGFPTVILEAWACGCPVITSDIPPLRALSEKAICFSEPNVKNFTEIIHQIITDKHGKTISDYGLEEVKKYDWEIVSRQYYNLYCDVFEKTKN